MSLGTHIFTVQLIHNQCDTQCMQSHRFSEVILVNVRQTQLPHNYNFVLLCAVKNSRDKYHKNISAKIKSGYLQNASQVYTQHVTPVTEALDAAYMDIFSQVVCYNTVFPE